MKHLRVIAALTMLVSAPAFSQAQTTTTAPGAGMSATSEQEITKLGRQWLDAFFRGDTVAMDRFESEDFLVVAEWGSQTKQQQLARIQRAVKENKWIPKGTSQVEEDVSVRAYGDVAVRSGRFWNKRPNESDDVSKEKGVFTEVWVRREGRWQAAHLHYSILRSSPHGTQTATKP